MSTIPDAAVEAAMEHRVQLIYPAGYQPRQETLLAIREYVVGILTAAAPHIAAQALRDEYHTMDELYEYRMLYNAAWVNSTDLPVVKSWRHSDGELCFGGGWFVVVATLPTGQVSNHYKSEYWDLFIVPAVWTPPEYDGHTPQEAVERLRAWLRASTAARIEATP